VTVAVLWVVHAGRDTSVLGLRVLRQRFACRGPGVSMPVGSGGLLSAGAVRLLLP